MGLCMSVMKASARCNAADIKRLPLPETVNRKKILWSYAIPVCAFHLLLPLAFVPWLFSWTGLILVPLGNYVFCSLGIGAGYHRLLTHRGFRARNGWSRRWPCWASAACRTRPPAGCRSTGCITSTPTSSPTRTARWSISCGGTSAGYSSRTGNTPRSPATRTTSATCCATRST